MAKKLTATQEANMIKAAGYRFEVYSYTVGTLRQVDTRLIAPDGTVLAECGTPWGLRAKALAHLKGEAA
jgi:hypothetical protein